MKLHALPFRPSNTWRERVIDALSVAWKNVGARWQEREPDPIVLDLDQIDQLRKGIAGERTSA